MLPGLPPELLRRVCFDAPAALPALLLACRATSGAVAGAGAGDWAGAAARAMERGDWEACCALQGLAARAFGAAGAFGAPVALYGEAEVDWLAEQAARAGAAGALRALLPLLVLPSMVPRDSTRSLRVRRPFQEATTRGHVDACRVLLEDGGARRLFHVGDLLLEAAAQGQTAVCRLVLDEGCDEGLGNALCEAAGNGHLAACELILDRGEAGDDYASDDCGALAAAAGAGHLDVCRLLLARGACADAVSELYEGAPADEIAGAYPLVAAADGGHLEVVRLLLAHGARADAYGSEALQRAANSEALERMIAEGGAGGEEHLEVCRALLLAGASAEGVSVPESGDLALWRLLIDHGAYVTVWPLAAAAAEGREEACRVLLEAAARQNNGKEGPPVAACHDSYALAAAAERGHAGVCRLLLAHGARAADARVGEALRELFWDWPERDKLPALTEVCRALLAAGAAPHADALEGAAACGAADACRALLAAGASARACKALEWACEVGRAEAARALLLEGDADASSGAELLGAVRHWADGMEGASDVARRDAACEAVCRVLLEEAPEGRRARADGPEGAEALAIAERHGCALTAALLRETIAACGGSVSRGPDAEADTEAADRGVALDRM